MADATDSKSVARKGVWVQVPPPAFGITIKKKRLLDTVHHGPIDAASSRCQAICEANGSSLKSGGSLTA